MTKTSGVAEVADGNLSEKVLIEIDLSIYPQDAALKAAYSVSNRCLVNLRTASPGTLAAEISRLDGTISTPLKMLCGEFEKALTDFALRGRILAETRNIQEALLRRAFTEATPKAS